MILVSSFRTAVQFYFRPYLPGLFIPKTREPRSWLILVSLFLTAGPVPFSPVPSWLVHSQTRELRSFTDSGLSIPYCRYSSISSFLTILVCSFPTKPEKSTSADSSLFIPYCRSSSISPLPPWLLHSLNREPRSSLVLVSSFLTAGQVPFLPSVLS